MDDSHIYLGNESYGVIADFLRGVRPDWDGRWLEDIRHWDHQRLEDDHHWVQWLFPLTTESEAVFAPRLRPFEVDALRTERRLRRELQASFVQFLGFLGLRTEDRPEGLAVNLDEAFPSRSMIWLTENNHNYLRISRALGTLTLAGCEREVGGLSDALESIARTPRGRECIDPVVLWYWRRAAGRTPR